MVRGCHPFLFSLILLSGFYLSMGSAISHAQPSLPSAKDPTNWENNIREYIFNFQFDKAAGVITQNSNSVKAPYYENLNECIKLLIQADDEQYHSAKSNQHQRLRTLNESLKNFPGHEAEVLKCKAEIHYHWAILKFLNKDEGQAIVDLKKSYDLIKELDKKYPDQSPNKLESIYNIAMDQVPQKYAWVMDLLGYEGNAEAGFKHLQTYLNEGNEVTYCEEQVTYAILKQVISQQSLTSRLSSDGINTEFERLALIHLLLEEKNPDKALDLLEKSPIKATFSHYLYIRAQINLYRGRYNKAIIDLLQFTKKQRSERNMKAAYLMLYYCYYLKGETEKADAHLKQIESVQKSYTSKDRYANHFVENGTVPLPQLLKARLYFDGGYYTKALDIIRELEPNTSILTPNQVLELYYRKARIYHDLDNPENFEKAYLKVITFTAQKDNSQKGLNHFYTSKSALELAKYWYSSGKKNKKAILDMLDVPFQHKGYAYEEAIQNEAHQLKKQIR